MIEALGHTKDGIPHVFQERDTSALESTAERLGLVRYEFTLENGHVEIVRKLGSEWVIFA